MRKFTWFCFIQALFQSLCYHLNGFFLPYDAAILFVLIAIFFAPRERSIRIENLDRRTSQL